jgi:hypothetical protein
MRGLWIVAIAACGTPRPAAPPASKVGAIDAWVIDANGPVANADVRVVPYAGATCACTAKPDGDDPGFDNSLPECSCPEQLAALRARLATCAWPTPATAVLRTESQGHIALEPSALGSMLEATTTAGARWLALPARADRVAIEVKPASPRRFTVDNAIDVRAVLFFADGHCMPFRRDAAMRWVTVAPVPATDDWPVLVVDAPGFATIVRAWDESGDDLDLALHRAMPVSGTCSGDRVVLANPMQHVAIAPRLGRFSIDGALDLQSHVTCFKGDDVVEEWLYAPATGLEEYGGMLGGGLGRGQCHDVDVVDRAGSPIAGAEISFDGDPGSQFSSSTLSYTNARGRACVDSVYEGGDLVVHAPLDRGGECAGKTTLRVTPRHMALPAISVPLDVTPLRRERYRGRLISPEKIPVAGAAIAVRDVSPSTACSVRSDVIVTSGVDGAFELPLLPAGELTLNIQHDWYAEHELTVVNPSRERELELDRGIRWTGRVLDPEGKPIEKCGLVLELESHRTRYGACSKAGFAFSTLAPGEAKVTVRLEQHALGMYRGLEITVKIGDKSRREDIRWPSGEPIAGRVVDKDGTPIPGARLIAVPRGTARPVSQRAPGEIMLEADPNGRFVFHHLAPGVWTITGDHRAYKVVHVDVNTGTTDLKIVTTR